MVQSHAVLTPAAPETEKITINLGHVDLGRIDLLVREGFFSNRSDLIRTAIRTLLEKHGATTEQGVVRHMLEMGVRRWSRADLEVAQAAGETLDIKVLGLAILDDDIPPELAQATIARLTVLGTLQAPKAVKAALADRLA